MADYEMNKRLKYLITEVYKTTPFDFSKKYDDTRGVKTSAIMRERNGISNKMLDLICSAYPEINRNWLLTGEGQILNNSQNENSGTIVNNGGDGNSFFTPATDKDELIQQLKDEVSYLRQLVTALTSK